MFNFFRKQRKYPFYKEVGSPILFSSVAYKGGDLNKFSQEQIKNEPQLYSCDFSTAHRLGGEITHGFLEALADKGRHYGVKRDMSNIIIDSRSCMLKEGWYPSIPGWHLDGIPRTRKDGQPDHIAMRNCCYPKLSHCLAVFGDCSLTEFLRGEIVLTEPDLGKIVYGEWHKKIEKELRRARNRLETEIIEPEQLYFFDWRSFHQARPATKTGFRFFIRASWNHGRKYHNEQRFNSNVYIPNTFGGW